MTSRAPNRKRHAAAGDGRWGLLGELLQARRQELGFKFRPAFARERLPLTDDGNPNVRLVTDIENNYRPGTYSVGTLRLLAQAYAVTYESVQALLAGGADRLVPAPPAPSPAADLGWTPPTDEAGRDAANRPWFDEINERRVALAARGVTDPSGPQMFPDAPDDAKAWDGIGPQMEIRDRVWIIADLRRRAAGRSGTSGNSAAGA